VRGDMQRVLDAYGSGDAPESGIRLIVHTRQERTAEPDPAPPVEDDDEDEDDELLWELRRLLASSGGTIADVAHALERRGQEVDRKGRELLEDEVRAVEVDIAILKSLLSDPVDWDRECDRLLAGEIPPFEDDAADDEHDDED
jgi:hypothetical protein